MENITASASRVLSRAAPPVRRRRRGEVNATDHIVFLGTSSVGRVEAVFAQIAADALEIPMDRIRVHHGRHLM
jgi:CO/xanthine dehydrogenase Mo-binding subunit